MASLDKKLAQKPKKAKKGKKKGEQRQVWHGLVCFSAG